MPYPRFISGELQTRSKDKCSHLTDMSSANAKNTCVLFLN